MSVNINNLRKHIKKMLIVKEDVKKEIGMIKVELKEHEKEMIGQIETFKK
jgi:hypothetical protein